MACVVPLMKKHPETARQVLSHLRVLFARVRAQNLRGDDPTEAVDAVLGPIHPRRRNQPMQSLPYSQVGEALQRVFDSGAHWSTKGVCLLMALTGTRQKEVRSALWEEIDLDQALWRIPATRTKEGRPHNVPLSRPVLDVLADSWVRTGGVGLVFPAATGRPISPGTLRKLLKSLGVLCVPHGFRASYRTWMSEHGVPEEVSELAIGHTHKNVPPGIDLLEQRRDVAEQWGHYCTKRTDPDQPGPPSRL
jgi:integrase